MTRFNVQHVTEVDSTNTVLMQRAASAPHGCHLDVLVADVQRVGRGQRGRVWQSAPGAAVLCSVAWQFARLRPLEGLSLAVGVMLAETLDAWVPTTVRLKWPNDLLVEWPHARPDAMSRAPRELRKLGGILIETVASADATRTAVIGFGINVSSAPIDVVAQDAARESASAPLPAACLTDVAPTPPTRDVVLAALLNALEQGLPQFERAGFSAFQARWWQRHAFANQAVTALLPDGTQLAGIITAITERGALVLHSERGLHTLVSGEVSLRAFGA